MSNKKNAVSFDENMAELEQIVAEFEGGDISLEESISKYKRAKELIKNCSKEIEKAKMEIDIIENDDAKNTS